MIVDTVKVKSNDTESGFIIVNKSDFNAAEHELFNAEAPAPAKPPAIKDLPAHLETLATAEEVTALQTRDDRPTATPLYEARLKAITDAAK